VTMFVPPRTRPILPMEPWERESPSMQPAICMPQKHSEGGDEVREGLGTSKTKPQIGHPGIVSGGPHLPRGQDRRTERDLLHSK
jgi:hypothetical protein